MNFWLFYGSHCADCIKLLNDILPPILAKYEPDQVVVYKYDLEKGPSEMKQALEEWHGLTYSNLPVLFIGEYALLGNQQIQAKLGTLIEDYLARGGVELLRPNLVATPTPTPPPIRTPTPPPSPGIVRAVLFWSATCPHCHQVINNVLPPLQQKYGARLDIQMFELSDPAALELFEATLDALHVPPDQWGVPFLIVGDEVLVGSLEIPERLPSLIEKHLAEGGIGWPSIPGLEKFVGTPPTVPAFTTTPAVRVVVNDTPIPPIGAPAKPVVRAVMFWMNGCPHCEQVIKQVLPPLQQKYGEQLDIRLVEVITAQDVDELYRLGAMFGFSKEQTGVPFLIIANRALVGSEQIPAELPGLIDELLATGGADLPNIAGLDPTRMTKATTNPTLSAYDARLRNRVAASNDFASRPCRIRAGDDRNTGDACRAVSHGVYCLIQRQADQHGGADVADDRRASTPCSWIGHRGLSGVRGSAKSVGNLRTGGRLQHGSAKPVRALVRYSANRHIGGTGLSCAASGVVRWANRAR